MVFDLLKIVELEKGVRRNIDDIVNNIDWIGSGFKFWKCRIWFED